MLHEQPENVRRRTPAEAVRVVKPGGKIVVVDYHCPSPWHPLAYCMGSLLRRPEPYALGLWRHDICKWLPPGAGQLREETYFGGIYQKLVFHR